MARLFSLSAQNSTSEPVDAMVARYPPPANVLPQLAKVRLSSLIWAGTQSHGKGFADGPSKEVPGVPVKSVENSLDVPTRAL